MDVVVVSATKKEAKDQISTIKGIMVGDVDPFKIRDGFKIMSQVISIRVKLQEERGEWLDLKDCVDLVNFTPYSMT